MNRINAKRVVILYAEDDPGDQELTKRAFELGHVRNELHIVQDGEEALDYLMRRGRYVDPSSSPRPDLLIIDLNMPKLDGRKVLEEIQKNNDCPKPAVIILSTSQNEEDIIQSYKLGVKSFITKPVDVDDFIRAIRVLEEYWFEVVVLPPRED